MQPHSHKTPPILLTIYIILFVALAINPYDRTTWWVENIPILIVVGVLVLTYSSFKFSNFAYFLMGLFLCYHTIGGHFTFELVPFDWGNHLLSKLGFDFIIPEGRNNFDRLGHFLVGVFAYPVVEISVRKKWVSNNLMAWLLGVFALGFWAASYEIIEMVYAITEGGKSGAAFLGSQGDVWDAQKDMLLDILGGCVFGLLALLNQFNWRQRY
jgi:putative membrane protein